MKQNDLLPVFDTDAFDAFFPNVDIDVIEDEDDLAWQEAMNARLDEEEELIAQYHENHPNDPMCIGEEAYPWYGCTDDLPW